jgi:membrane protein DedA with SNARE-associated domain
VRRVAEVTDPKERRILAVLVVPIVAVSIASWVGDALSPTLLVDSPLLLVLLVPRLRFLILAAPQVAFIPFFLVAVIRLLLTDPLFFLFGYRYGEAGIRWVEKTSGAPGALSWVERWFRRAAYPLVALLPNNLICVLSGAAGMNVPTFMVLNLGGTAIRVALIWWLGDVFSEPLLEIVDFVGRYQWWFTGATVVLTFAWLWRAGRKGRLGIETPGEVVEELKELQAEVATEGGADANESATGGPRDVAPGDGSGEPGDH